jgi:hypothetical protein
MTVRELIQIAKTRLTYLAAQRETAFRLGDELQVAQIDKEASETQETLNQLLTLEP